MERILAQAHGDAAIECECALILSGAAGFADDPDKFAELHDPWAQSPPLTDPLLLYVHSNRRAFRALFEGDPAQARHHQQRAPRGDFGSAFRYVSRWGEFVIALSYLWEGQVRLAENLLRPALPGAENELGRRNPFVCMLAALLASAVWERDRPQEAAALLANRLDVIERSGLPDAVLLGVSHGGTDGLGRRRRAPRVRTAGCAACGRAEPQHAAAVRRQPLGSGSDSMLGAFDPRRAVRCARASTRCSPATAFPADGCGGAASSGCSIWHMPTRQSPRRSGAARSRHSTERRRWPQSMQLGRVRIEVMALRAFALDRCGEKAVPLLKEAIGLAQTFGLERLFKDVHPALNDWVQQVTSEASGTPGERAAAMRP